jgi:hypothetical protein
MATLFLPVEGAAPTEAGSLLYHMLVDEPRPQPENSQRASLKSSPVADQPLLAALPLPPLAPRIDPAEALTSTTNRDQYLAKRCSSDRKLATISSDRVGFVCSMAARNSAVVAR